MFLKDKSAQGKRSVCNLLADHFSSVHSNSQLQDIDPFDPSELLISYTISVIEVLEAIAHLDGNGKSRLDGIPPYFLKCCRFSLVGPILYLFNKSLAVGVFANFWKQTFIFPIFKSGNKSDASNYRPISIISTLAKIFESISCSKFLFPKIGTHQHGFIRGRSVLSNLLLYNDFLFEAFKVDLQAASIYVDLPKAVDTVNQGLLIQKIWNAGIRGSLFYWVRSCGATSYEFPSPSGVPQGSNIGPILLCSVCESQN